MNGPRCKPRSRAYEVLAIMRRCELTTQEDIAHELGISKDAAARHLKEAWALDIIHIAGWDKSLHQPVPVYRWGNRRDARRPAARTNVERQRRHKERKREDQHAHH